MYLKIVRIDNDVLVTFKEVFDDLGTLNNFQYRIILLHIFFTDTCKQK